MIGTVASARIYEDVENPANAPPRKARCRAIQRNRAASHAVVESTHLVSLTYTRRYSAVRRMLAEPLIAPQFRSTDGRRAGPDHNLSPHGKVSLSYNGNQQQSARRVA